MIYWKGVLYVLAYIKGTPWKGLIYQKFGYLKIVVYYDTSYVGDKGNKKSTSGYCTCVGGNLITWRSKKQNVVSKSNTEVDYRSMTKANCEIIWLKPLLIELGVLVQTSMSMHCDNQVTIFITSNSVFHERTKHSKVDCHCVRDMVMKGIISNFICFVLRSAYRYLHYGSSLRYFLGSL